MEGLYLLQDVHDRLEDNTAQQQIADFLTGNAGMREARYRGVIIDEFSPGDDVQMFNKSYYDEWTRACAAILDDPRYAGRLIMPAMGYNMYDFEKSAAFLTGLIEHGSYVIEEHYLNECDTEDEAWRSINEIGAGLEPRRQQASPGYTRHAIKLLSYLQREIWNPACNFRVFLDMQFEHHATRPEFFGVGGIGAYSSYNCNNEEYVRWVAELMRHYAMEGHTDRLSTDPYEVAQIRNPDFLEGTGGWTLQPAEEEGSMRVRSHKGYGLTQERRPHRSHTEMPFLWTRRSGSMPNRFSQEIRNLEARQTLSRAAMGGRLHRAAGRGAERRAAGDPSAGGRRRRVGRLVPHTVVHGQRVHLCQLSAALQRRQPLLLQDPPARLPRQGSHGSTGHRGLEERLRAGRPIGQELMFNMIDVHPYLEPEGAGGS